MTERRWEKRTLVYREPGKLKGWKRNAKKHPAEQVSAIAASMKTYGFNNPVLLKDDDATIGAGHGRQLAALEILAAGDPLPTPDGKTIPTITLKGLTEDEWRAYVIADNKLAEGASWDENLLKVELGELRASGTDLSVLGFSNMEVEGLFPAPKTPDAPGSFPAYGEGIVTTYCCPQCKYRWSGKPHE